MPLYINESLNVLRQRIDIVDVISSYIDLNRAGSSYKALCPFHDENTPSFILNKGDSHYHCYGCGAHGDAIQFLMDYQQMSFIEAVETLAGRFNVILEEVSDKEQKINKKRIREALESAAQIYHFNLLHTEEGHHVTK